MGAPAWALLYQGPALVGAAPVPPGAHIVSHGGAIAVQDLLRKHLEANGAVAVFYEPLGVAAPAAPYDHIGAVFEGTAVVETEAGVLQATDKAAAGLQVPFLPVGAATGPLHDVGAVGHDRVVDVQAKAGGIVYQLHPGFLWPAVGGQYVAVAESWVAAGSVLVEVGEKTAVAGGQVGRAIVVVVEQGAHDDVVPNVARELVPADDGGSDESTVGVLGRFSAGGKAQSVGRGSVFVIDDFQVPVCEGQAGGICGVEVAVGAVAAVGDHAVLGPDRCVLPVVAVAAFDAAEDLVLFKVQGIKVSTIGGAAAVGAGVAVDCIGKLQEVAGPAASGQAATGVKSTVLVATAADARRRQAAVSIKVKYWGDGCCINRTWQRLIEGGEIAGLGGQGVQRRQ